MRYYLAKNDGSGKVYLEDLEHPKPEPFFDRGRAQGEMLTMMPAGQVSNPNKPAPGLEFAVSFGSQQGRLSVRLEYCSRATYVALEALHATGATVYWGAEDPSTDIEELLEGVWEVAFMPEEQGWRATPLSGTWDFSPLEMDFIEYGKVS